MFGPERAGQMVFDTPLLGKGAWGACEAMSVLHRLRLYLRKQHILSNRGLRICCQRFGERYRAGRKGKKSPPHYAPGRGRSLLSLSVLADGSALQSAQCHSRTICRCSARNRIMTGMIASVEPAIGSSCWLLSCTRRLAIAIGGFSFDTDGVTTQPQLNRKLVRGEQRCFSPHIVVFWAVGRKRPPLCRGCAPATPPSKTIPNRPCVLIPAVPLQQRGCRKPNTQSDSLNGGSDKGLVKTDTVDGLVVTRWAKRLMRRSHLKNQAHASSPNSCLPSPVSCPVLPNFCSSSRGSPG